MFSWISARLGFGQERYYRVIYHVHPDFGYFRVVIGRIAFIPIFINCVPVPEVDQPLFRSLVPTVEGALRRDGQRLYGNGFMSTLYFAEFLKRVFSMCVLSPYPLSRTYRKRELSGFYVTAERTRMSRFVFAVKGAL